jgi:Phosphotransferase enzyme family
VLRVDDHVLKAYSTEQRYRAGATRLRAADRLAIPAARFEAALPDLRVTVQGFLGGRPPDSARAVSRSAGQALRELHASRVGPLQRFPPVLQLAAVANLGELFGAIAPHVCDRVEALVRRLARTLPQGLCAVPCHGDFHVGQLRCRDEGLAVIDFDELTGAPPALDLATYAAHEVRGDERDLAAARAILDEVAAGYGSRPDGLDWYFSALILRRSSHPFTHFREDWPRGVETMVAAAEAALER